MKNKTKKKKKTNYYKNREQINTTNDMKNKCDVNKALMMTIVKTMV